MTDDDERDIRALYSRLLSGWNRDSGEDFAAPFAEDGEVVGFDGSLSEGRVGIAEQMQQIFDDHATGSYVGKVKTVRKLGSDAALLRAVAGVVPAGAEDLEPKLNAVQALVAARVDGQWRVVLYQNTPAQFHGRPELAETLTRELRAELSRARSPDGAL
jgi:uncharacterized protein (TIGR02246 family)